MMKVIGLTGGICSGKSTVSQFLAELGAVTLDLDKIGHEALKPGHEAHERVINEFGPSIVTTDGNIDRNKLGEMVFHSNKARLRLQDIIHPIMDNMVMAQLEVCRRKGVKVVVLEAAILLEAGKSSIVDEIWVTIAPEATIIKRLKKRPSLSESEAQARIRSQISNEERIKHADVIIDTDCSLDELKTKVKELWLSLLKQNISSA